MSTQTNIAINVSTIYEALEGLEHYNLFLEFLEYMIEGVREGNTGLVLAMAEHIADTITEEVNSPEFIEHWPGDAVDLIAA